MYKYNPAIINLKNKYSPKEEGFQIARNIRNLIMHDANSSLGVGSVGEILLSVMLKVVEDNRFELEISIPSELLSIIDGNSSGVKIIDVLVNYLHDIECKYGLKDNGKNISSELLNVKTDNIIKKLDELAYYFKNLNFHDVEGKHKAIGIAVGILYHLDSFLIPNIKTIPFSLLKLLDVISNIECQMEVYGITTDSGSTLAYLTAGMDVNVTVQQDFENSIINEILWIIAGYPSKFKGNQDNVEWLPLNMKPKKYDRVYAFPVFPSDIDIKTVFDRVGKQASDYISWWPEMLSTGQWVYARRVLKTLKEDGVGFVLFPLGMLSRMSNFIEVRKRFLDENVIDAVIELPAGIFKTTAMKTALLIIKKNRKEKKIRMINLNSSAAKGLLSKDHTRIVDFDEKKVAFMLEGTMEMEGVVDMVSIDTIAKNGFCLSPSAYISQAYNFDERKVDFYSIMEETEELMNKFKSSDNVYKIALQKFIKLQEKWENDK